MLEVLSINIGPIIDDYKSILFKIKTNNPAEIKNLISWQNKTRNFLDPASDRYKDCILICRDSDSESEYFIRKCFVKFVKQNGEEVEAEIESSCVTGEFNLEEYSKFNYKLYLKVLENENEVL